jgi:hypothetical protein
MEEKDEQEINLKAGGKEVFCLPPVFTLVSCITTAVRTSKPTYVYKLTTHTEV